MSKATHPGSGAARPAGSPAGLRLADGSRVGVIGGGPAGSFFSLFLLQMARRAGLAIEVDVYEYRDFFHPGPAGCNMCGGIVSESLVQNLAAEGVPLPPTVIQRGIDAYHLHMDVGSVRIETPVDEARIGAVYRGPGPRDVKEIRWKSFDGHLLTLAGEAGARVIPQRVRKVTWEGGRPALHAGDEEPRTYDLLAVAAGINAGSLKLFEEAPPGYEPPGATKTYIREYHLGEEEVGRTLGSAMQVFLLDIPRLEFAAVIPKGEYATVCMLGEAIDNDLVARFLASPEVRSCMPDEWLIDKRSCQCGPRISISAASRPYDDRIVFVGDCAVTRLYKDGIGAAYRAAKAAAATAVFQGVSRRDFERHYRPICRSIEIDNALGRVVFLATRLIQRSATARRAVLRMTAREQTLRGAKRRMSRVLWDTFTGSAPYREILLRTLHPAFVGRLAWNLAAALVSPSRRSEGGEAAPARDVRELGHTFGDGEVIFRQGEAGETMYVIQEGQVEILDERGGAPVRLRVASAGELLGEMAIFGDETRSATLRALGPARLLTVDKRNFLQRIHQDPSLAVKVVETMSIRIRELSDELGRLRETSPRETRL